MTQLVFTFSSFIDPLRTRITIGGINRISSTLPHISLLTQTNDIDESIYCNKTSLLERCNGEDICYCVHRLKVKFNSTVELVILDESAEVGPVNHPFHLHGFAMFVMAMGQDPEKPATDNSETIGKTFPLKDTISIPSKGYTILRFRADNPGFWLFHCHMGNSV